MMARVVLNNRLMVAASIASSVLVPAATPAASPFLANTRIGDDARRRIEKAEAKRLRRQAKRTPQTQENGR